jgi:hypothetical protein
VTTVASVEIRRRLKNGRVAIGGRGCISAFFIIGDGAVRGRERDETRGMFKFEFKVGNSCKEFLLTERGGERNMESGFLSRSRDPDKSSHDMAQLSVSGEKPREHRSACQFISQNR